MEGTRRMISVAEEFYQILAYHTDVLLSSGDMEKFLKHDIEGWMAGQNAYGVSCSNCLDFQQKIESDSEIKLMKTQYVHL